MYAQILPSLLNTYAVATINDLFYFNTLPMAVRSVWAGLRKLILNYTDIQVWS